MGKYNVIANGINSGVEKVDDDSGSFQTLREAKEELMVIFSLNIKTYVDKIIFWSTASGSDLFPHPLLPNDED